MARVCVCVPSRFHSFSYIDKHTQLELERVLAYHVQGGGGHWSAVCVCVYFGSVSYRHVACRLVLFQTSHPSSEPAHIKYSVTCFSVTELLFSLLHILSLGHCALLLLALPSFLISFMKFSH